MIIAGLVLRKNTNSISIVNFTGKGSVGDKMRKIKYILTLIDNPQGSPVCRVTDGGDCHINQTAVWGVGNVKEIMLGFDIF